MAVRAGRARGLLLVGGDPGRSSRGSGAGWSRASSSPCSDVDRRAAGRAATRAPQAPYDDAVDGARRAGRCRDGCGRRSASSSSAGAPCVTVQGRAGDPAQRWLVWEPGAGSCALAGLEPARPSDLVAAAGHGRPGSVARGGRGPTGRRRRRASSPTCCRCCGLPGLRPRRARHGRACGARWWRRPPRRCAASTPGCTNRRATVPSWRRTAMTPTSWSSTTAAATSARPCAPSSTSAPRSS